MNKYLSYLRTLLLHKWYVGKACWKLGLSWLAIVHDWTKFTPVEFKRYADKFGKVGINFNRDKSGYYDSTIDKEFNVAWNHHVHRNKHHWQYWCVPKDNIEGSECFEILDIPNEYILEMLCDWWGASKAYKGKGIAFFWKNNKDKLRLSPATRLKIEFIIPGIIGILDL